MTVVSTQDFVANHNRYFDLAIDEPVAVKRGNYMFNIVCNFEPPQKILQPDDDLRRAISMDEFKERVLVMVDKLDKKHARK